MDFFDIEFPELPSIAPDLMFEEEPLPLTDTFSSRITPVHREALLHFVLDDHAYAKPYPTRSTTNNKRVTPLTILKLHQVDQPEKGEFKRNESRCQSHGSEDDDDDDIDVVSVDDKSDNDVLKYDKTKAHNVMNEVEAYLNSLWKDVDKDDDEKITRTTWSKEQAGVFDMVYKLINSYQLAKLSYYKNANEPVLRRLVLDKATKRIRQAFGSVFWNPKLIVWLHTVMIDGLGSSLFLCYLEILQSLKKRTPALFERILLSDKAATDKELSLPNLGVRLKKTWDPSTGLQSKVTMDKFPATPFIIMVPSGPSIPQQSTKRSRFWNNQLSNFSKVFAINVPAYRTLEGYVIKHYLEHCISAIRTKILELRDRFPERHIILVGWGVGSLVSLKVANLDKVDAIVCLGFPTNGIDGDTSEEYWKGLTKIECPVLFFIGTNAMTNSVADTEKLRRQMKTQTNLILIESAEELLRLTTSQKKLLGMTQNMIDKLIQDEIYLFLKSVLFKPKPVITPVSKGPGTGKKRKKKGDIVEKGETKKKKKSNVKSSSLLSDNVNDNCSLLPLDVSISSLSSVPLGNSQGLLTTGSVYTSIPVTQLQSESLTNVTCNMLIPNAGVSDVTVSTAKEFAKRSSTKEPKEKAKRSKSTKKSSITKNIGISPGSQKLPAETVNQQTSHAVTDQLLAGETRSSKNNVQQPVTFQRIPTGSFVLSGASGQVRLQGAANIVYLQQATSTTTQLLSPPTINTTSSAFTAVMASSPVASNPPKINIVPSSNFKFGPITPNLTHKGLSGVISSTGCGSLVFSATTSHSPSTDVSLSVDAKAINADTQATVPLTSNTSNMDTLTTISPTMPTATVSSTSTTSTIMTHLSANDIRYLASLIAKHSSSRPNSPISSGIGSPVLPSKTDAKSHMKNSRENSDDIKTSASATLCISEVRNNTNKSSLTSIFDKKINVTPVNQSTKKGVQPPSLVQRVATIQQKDQIVKMKTPRMKSSKLSTTMPVGHIITSTKGSSIATNSKVIHKVPATLTIPISRLQANINLSSSLSYAKSINVPLLSSCLSQDKIIITSTKSSESLGSRALGANTAVTKKSPIMVGPLGNNAGKLSNMTVFPSSRAPTPSSGRTTVGGIFLTKTPFSSSIKSPVKGNSPSPITLHLPSPATLRDPKVLRKAVSDVKVVGVLSQQPKSQMTSLVNLSALRSISNPSSPLRSPTSELYDDINEVKSEDCRTTFNPLNSSIMTAIGDNVKPLTPPNIPSSSLLAASIPRDTNSISRSNISGKGGTTAFLGKLFGGPKSIVDPTWGKLSFTKNQEGTSEPDIDEDGDEDMDDDDVDDYHDDDENPDNDSDVDFAISPASPTEDTQLGTVYINKPVIFDPVKRSNVTKIVYAPNHSNDYKPATSTTSTNFVSKNIIDIARAKLRETQFKDGNSSPSMGANTSKVSLELRSSLEEEMGSASANDSKLRFEPLKSSNTRAKLTSVLSRREGKSDNCSTMSILQNSGIITNPLVSKTSTLPAAVSKLRETEIKHSIVSNHSVKSSMIIPSLSLKPLTSLILCDSESIQSLQTASSEGITQDSVTSLSTMISEMSSEHLNRMNAIHSATANGITLHELKGIPSIGESNKTTTLNMENKIVSIANIGALSFATMVSSAFTNTDSKTLLDNIDIIKGRTIESVDTKGTPVDTIESKGSHIGTKVTCISATLSKGTTVTNSDQTPSDITVDKGIQLSQINTKGELFHSIESKWPFLNTESKGKSLTNSKSKGPYVLETPQISKLYAKSSTKSPKEVSAYKIMIEEDPQPYITRSGRVNRSKYSIQYIDELDGKKTPKKRRLSSATSKDDSLLTKKNKMSEATAVTLESLVEAAELIKKENNSLVNGGGVLMEKAGNHVNELSEVDPTTSIAATAMLELLSVETAGVKNEKNMHIDVIKDDRNDDDDDGLLDKELHSESTSEIGGSNCVTEETDCEGVNHKFQDKKVNDMESEKVKGTNNMLLRTVNASSSHTAISVTSEMSNNSGIALITINTSLGSLPSLVPIQKTGAELPFIAPVKSEQVPMEDYVVENAHILAESTSAPTIPPLAAIQDMYNEKTLSLPVDVEKTLSLPVDVIKYEHDEVDSTNDNPDTPSIPMRDAVSLQSDNVAIIDDGATVNLTSTITGMPTLAGIQDKPNVEDSITSCSDIVLKHYKIDPPIVSTSSTLTQVAEIPDEEKIQSCKVECQSGDDECMTNMKNKRLNMDEDSTELMLKEKMKEVPPNSSPPALAIIQSNVHSSPELASANPDSLVNSLPPLAAIHINSRDCEGLNVSNNISNKSEHDESLPQETNTNIPRSPYVEPMSSTFNINTSPDISEPGNETILVDRTNVSEIKLTEEEITR